MQYVKALHVLMFVLLSTSLSFAKIDTSVVTDEIETLMYLPHDINEETVNKAILILTNYLKEEPNNIILLRYRAEAYNRNNKLEKSREDVKKIVSLRPDSITYLYWKCTLDEIIGDPKSEYMQCYNKVVDLSAKELGSKKNTTFGYIWALLMAERPEAKTLVENFIKTLSNSEMDILMKDLLLNFKRDKVLYEK